MSLPPTSPNSHDFSKRPSHFIVEVPASIAAGGLKKIAHNKNMDSMSLETEHFCGMLFSVGVAKPDGSKGRIQKPRVVL
jgi:hypothetical protein